MNLALIGGTGLYNSELFQASTKKKVKTPFGTVKVYQGKKGDNKIVFLPRHGKHHSIPPHKINYRANIYALKILDISRIISANSVGSINPNLHPGDIVIPHDFIDFTKHRILTFYDEEAVHIDVSTPYCNDIRQNIIKSQATIVPQGVYACTEGPRFETPSEIKMLQTLGADVVGMTGIPETTLAREMGLCYASVCTVTNYGAGMSDQKLTSKEVVEMMGKNTGKINDICREIIQSLQNDKRCQCKGSIELARVK
tara:strand:+ start:2465 stop:3229 length:765 start_codon:yes stop_codon:yes gene_type:complete